MAAVLIPLSPLGDVLGFIALPPAYWLLLVVVVVAYLALVEVVKRRFAQHGYRGRAGGTRHLRELWVLP